MPDPGMPPQGGQPQSGPPQGPGGPPQQSGGGGGVAGLMQNVDEALDHIKTTLMQAKGATPDEKQAIDQICSMYGALLESLGAPRGGGEQDSEGSGQGQTVPPEAAGNKGAVPSM